MKKTFSLLPALLFVAGLYAQEGFRPGERIAPFALEDAISGRAVSLRDFETEKGVILVFTCNTCPYANAYEQRIMALDRDFNEMGYRVIAVNPNDPGRAPGDRPEAMKERAEERGYTFPYLIDAKQEPARYFAAAKTPEVYLLKKRDDGGFETAYHGAIDDSPMDPEGAKNIMWQMPSGPLKVAACPCRRQAPPSAAPLSGKSR